MVSFIYMLRASTLEFVYVSESVTDVLGFNPQDLLHRSIGEFIHPDEKENALGRLRGIARDNKVASLVYLRLLHREVRFEVCIMGNSVANNVIAGSISIAGMETTTGAAARNASAEEVISVTELVPPPGDRWGPSTAAWIRSQLPRTAFLLDRFSVDCPITHCTNGAILDPETCVHQQGGFFRYVAERDEALFRTFITSLKRSGLEANDPTNIGFAYLTFTMCIAGRNLRSSPRSAHTSTNGSDEVRVSAVGSASSDGLILVVKRES